MRQFTHNCSFSSSLAAEHNPGSQTVYLGCWTVPPSQGVSPTTDAIGPHIPPSSSLPNEKTHHPSHPPNSPTYPSTKYCN
ncbi:hypothetical protein E2C01_013509 [Portunus trituberculatus]|uniref:Uncharacterized protein n=1 Tax=Portunus trituberculatus TaxID=210409 RepID=A0A5B7DGT9_PORTR|nr:hypothetical protein [Portunus trituberculatus]